MSSLWLETVTIDKIVHIWTKSYGSISTGATYNGSSSTGATYNGSSSTGATYNGWIFI